MPTENRNRLNQELLSDVGVTDMYLTLLETNPDCMKVLDKEGQIIYLNANGFCQLEFEESFQVHGKHWWDLWQDEKQDQIKDVVKRVFSGEEVHFIDYCPTAKGTPKWWDVRVSPIKKKNGEIDMILSVSRDVTDETRVAHELMRAEEKLKTGIKVANVALAEIDYHTMIVTMTAECAVLYGFAEDTQTVTLDELYGTFHPDHVDKVRALSKEVKAGAHNGLISVEHAIRLPDGAKRWLRVNKQLYFNNIDGSEILARGILSVQDITARYESNEKIQESEIRFRTLAESSPTWIWMTEFDHTISYANTKLLEYLGIRNSEKAMQSVKWEDHCHVDDIVSVKKGMSDSKGKAISFEARVKDSSTGSYNWHLFNAVPRVMHGDFNGFIYSGMTIQNQKLSELKKDEFIGIASHEMKTPLTVAKAYVQMLEMDLATKDPVALDYAVRASKSLDRLHDLISDLLDVSKIHNGKLEYQSAPFSVDAMLSNVVNDIQRSTSSHTIKLRGKVKTDFIGDENRIEQVLINLIGNAIKYSPKAKEVNVKVEKVEGELRITVSDNGIGISKASLSKLFDKFYRVEFQTVQFQGLGLGLYISHEIVVRHGGRIWAESSKGKGSDFIFTLPLATQ